MIEFLKWVPLGGNTAPIWGYLLIISTVGLPLVIIAWLVVVGLIDEFRQE